MTALIDDLLDVSRATRGEAALRKQPADMQQVMSEAVGQVSSLLQAKRHPLTAHGASESAWVGGDRKRLVQDR